jgi:hypothetical protein
MFEVNLFDRHFSHVSCSVLNRTLTKFKYVYNKMQWDGITLFTNEYMLSDLVDSVEGPIKIGWLTEPRVVIPDVYSKVDDVNTKFDYILTHDKSLLNSSLNYKFAPVGGCWIKEENYKVWPKDKLISIIASSKNFTDGQQLRHDIIKRHRGNLDVFGEGYNSIENKEEGLARHRFSVVVENCSVDGYFTEKLLDCFALGTVPIYWGCKNIEDFFDASGILRFETMEELDDIVSSLSAALYGKFQQGILQNFNLFKQYELTEDWMFEKYLRERLE